MLSLRSEKYELQTTGAAEKTQLQSCIGEFVTVKIGVRAEKVYTSSSEKRINIGLDFEDYPNTLDVTGLIRANGFFDGLTIGDVVLVGNIYTPADPLSGTYTITEIIDSNTARTTGVWTGKVLEFDGLIKGYVAAVTGLSKASIIVALNESGENSLVTEQKCEFAHNQYDGFYSLPSNSIPAIGSEWVTGGTIIIGDGLNDSGTAQYFTIKSEFVVHPVYLAGQLSDLQNLVKPSYWPNLKLQFSSEFGTRETGLKESFALSPRGRFGWFNEKYDGSEAKYSFSSYAINDGTSIVSRFQYNKTNTVTFNVATTSGTFATGNYVAVICVCRLADSEALYRNTKKSLLDNFCFENKRVVLGNPVSNGANFGTSLQFIKNAEFQYVSGVSATITLQIELGSYREDRFREMDTPNYAIWVILERIDELISDKSCLLLQVDKFEERLAEVDLFDAETVFIEHPFETSDKGEDSLAAFPTDDLVANTLLTLDYTGRETDEIKIISVTPSIRLVKTGEDDIILDEYTLSCENFPLVGSSPAIQDIATVVTRSFKLNQGVRTDLVFGRDYNNDSGSIKAWALNFPFIVRHEYWIKLLLDTIPSDLFDVAEPNKGINEFWHRYQTVSGWSLNYNLNIVFEQKGERAEQNILKPFTTNNYGANSDWSTTSIKSYEIGGSTAIESGGIKYAYGTKDLEVRASITHLGAVHPDLAGVEMVLWAEVYENGSVATITQASTVYDIISDSWFKPLDGYTKAKKEKNVDVYTISAILDSSKLPKNGKITLYARIYETSSIPFTARITNDLIIRDLMDGNYRIIQ
jgi:hypothetical protein